MEILKGDVILRTMSSITTIFNYLLICNVDVGWTCTEVVVETTDLWRREWYNCGEGNNMILKEELELSRFLHRGGEGGRDAKLRRRRKEEKEEVNLNWDALTVFTNLQLWPGYFNIYEVCRGNSLKQIDNNLKGLKEELFSPYFLQAISLQASVKQVCSEPPGMDTWYLPNYTFKPVQGQKYHG